MVHIHCPRISQLAKTGHSRGGLLPSQAPSIPTVTFPFLIPLTPHEHLLEHRAQGREKGQGPWWLAERAAFLGPGCLLTESASTGVFYSFGSQGEYPLHHPAFLVLRARTEPELLGGVPEALHIGAPALEEVQLPSVPPLEDLEGRWRSL